MAYSCHGTSRNEKEGQKGSKAAKKISIFVLKFLRPLDERWKHELEKEIVLVLTPKLDGQETRGLCNEELAAFRT